MRPPARVDRSAIAATHALLNTKYAVVKHFLLCQYQPMKKPKYPVIAIRVSAELRHATETEADKRGVKMSVIVASALKRYLKFKEKVA